MPPETPIPAEPTTSPSQGETSTPAPEPTGSDAPLLGGDETPAPQPEQKPTGETSILGGESDEGQADAPTPLTEEELASIEAPEGVDADIFRGVLKDTQLDSAAAAVLADHLKAYEAKRGEQLTVAREAQRVEWHKQIKTDPQWETKAKYANAALKKYASPEFRERLKGYDDPELIEMLAAVGKRDNPGSLPPGSPMPSKPAGPNFAALYPTSVN